MKNKRDENKRKTKKLIRGKMKKILVIIGIGILLPVFLFGAWSEEMQVNTPDTDLDNCPEITVDNEGHPWIFWYGIESGSINFYVSKLEDGLFSPEIPVNEPGNGVGNPFGVCTDVLGYPWVLYPYTPDGGATVMIKSSNWDGSEWQIETVDNSHWGLTDIALDPTSGMLWAMYEADDNMVARKWDNGWTGYWFVNDPGSEFHCFHPSIAVDTSGIPWAVWMRSIIDSNGDDTGEIFWSKLEGNQFIDEATITLSDTCHDSRPQIAIAPDGTPWAVWQKYMQKELDPWGYWTYSNAEVFYSRYIGDVWTEPVPVNGLDESHHDKFPTIIFDPFTEYPTIVWSGKIEGQQEIFQAKWNGTAFEPRERITNNTVNDNWSEAAFDSNGNLYIIYEKGWEIYTIIDYVPIHCSVPDITYGEPGETLFIPVIITDLPATGIDSVNFSLSYDTGLLLDASIDTSGTILSGTDWTYEYDVTGNLLSVSLSGTDVICNGGTLVNLLFTVSQDAQNGDETSLHFENFVFNDGLPEAITHDGTFIVNIIGIGSEDNYTGRYTLQNYPNPFANSTTIQFTIKEQEHVNLSIYNLKGQLVETLVDAELSPADVHKIQWNGKVENERLPNGIYFYKLETVNTTLVRKMILIR
jgi:hypothetical protein